MRNGAGRFTQDIDLARKSAWEDLKQIEEEISAVAQSEAQDPFTFHVIRATWKTEPQDDDYSTPTVEVRLEARLGATEFQRFKIDVTKQRHTQMPLERVWIEPLLSQMYPDEGREDFMAVATAIESHLADKICAMYEPHINGVSTRYRDLADVIQILRTQNFSAERFAHCLEHETNRRNFPWPTKIISPGPSWGTEFPRQAKKFDEYPRELRTLEAALEYVGKCLDEVLHHQRTDGVWSFEQQCWVE